MSSAALTAPSESAATSNWPQTGHLLGQSHRSVAGGNDKRGIDRDVEQGHVEQAARPVPGPLNDRDPVGAERDEADEISGPKQGMRRHVGFTFCIKARGPRIAKANAAWQNDETR